MPVPAPSRKVSAGLVAGAVMTIFAWASKAFAGVEIPAEVALAGSTILVFCLQYAIPNPEEPL